MNASTQMALKLGIVGVTVIGIFLLAALGRIDAADSLHDIVIVVGGLVLALGISGGLANGAEKLVQGQTPETGPAVVVTQSLAPAAKAMFPSKPPANERGFVHLRSLAAVLGLGVILVGATGATCTPSQVVQAIVTVAVDACQEAPQLIPPGTTAGTIVAVICQIIDASTGKPTGASQAVFVSPAAWNSMKLQYQKEHGGHLPGGMSPAVAQ
jgi:hypothetical protein